VLDSKCGQNRDNWGKSGQLSIPGRSQFSRDNTLKIEIVPGNPGRMVTIGLSAVTLSYTQYYDDEEGTR